MNGFIPVAKLDDLPEDEIVGATVDGRAIVLVRREGTVYALEDRCSHEEFPLSAGDCASGQITCALHGARFDIASGAPRALPAVLPVQTYEVRVEGDDVLVNLGD